MRQKRRIDAGCLFCWLVLACLTGQLLAGDPVDGRSMQYPIAVAAAADATVYVADRQLPGIWKLSAGRRSILFEASRALRTPLNAVRCLCLDHQGRLLVGDSATRDVYRFNDSGAPVPLTHGWIGIPMSIAVAEDGTIYTADLELHRIWKMGAAGSDRPEEFAVINSPRGLTLDADGNLWVLSTSSRQGQILQVRPDGTVIPLVTGHPFRLPHNLVRMPDGVFFVTDNYSRCVWRVTPDGRCAKWISGAPLDRPVGLCRLHDDLLISDPHLGKLFRLTTDKSLTVFAPPADRQ